jgi:hypothetical protein
MVTDKMVCKLWRLVTAGKGLSVAAARCDMDDKTARKYRRLQKLPSELARPHYWRTRVDPFAEVWAEVCALLEEQPGLQAKTIFGDLQRRYPGRFSDGQLRTLQRKLQQWRATAGPAKEVFFSQVHEPGRLAASDFTHMNDLGVTIGKQPFEHMVYHFVLTYSNWETATICFSESFESLSEGLQNALWELGGLPTRHRTDRMSLAVNNASEGKEFRQRYQGLLEHYGLIGEKIQAGHAHENGDIEQRHRRFKEALDQALMLRGSRDFADRQEYARFLHALKDQLNAGRRQRLAEEVAVLRSLPARRLEACRRLQCRVDQGSLIHVERNGYMVPSRLIGVKVDVRLYAEHLEVWYAQQLVERLPRLRGRDKHQVNYRYIIDWLVRKPGAFAQYRYRQELFPSSVFRLAYDTLVSQDPATADKEYLQILHLAAQESETVVEATLRSLLAAGQPLVTAAVEILVKQSAAPAVPEVTIDAVDLHVFDDLLTEEESDHGSEREGVAETTAPRVASADDADQLRGTGTTGGAGDPELRALPAATVRAGMSGAADEAYRPPATAIATAAGEEPGNVRSETPAGQAGAAGAEPARRQFGAASGEPFGLWQGRFRENPSLMWIGPGAGTRGTAGVVYNLESVGARTARGQTRSEVEEGTEAFQELRGVADRRLGLRATESRGDGGAVHVVGRTLRAWQCLVDQQSAVLQVGKHLQRSDDDGGGHRSSGAPQRDLGAEPAQLSSGRGQEGDRNRGHERDERGGRINAGRSAEEPGAGPGSAPRPVAALRVAPLRQAPPPRTGHALDVWQTPLQFQANPQGIFNCH